MKKIQCLCNPYLRSIYDLSNLWGQVKVVIRRGQVSEKILSQLTKRGVAVITKNFP